MLFLGDYDVTIDSKGRFLLPKDCRKQIPENEISTQFIISRGYDKCLNFYTISEWEKYSSKLDRLNEFNPKVQKLKRILVGGASKVELDSAGRILIPKTFQEYAGLEKDMIMTAVGNKFELWDKDKYVAYIQNASEDIEDLSNELLGGSIMDPFE